MKPLKILLIINAFLTIAAFILGSFFPPVLFEWVGVTIPHAQNLAPYMLGAAELPIGLLSLGVMRIKDAKSVRLMSVAFAVFHFASVFEELHATSQGIEGGAVVPNMILRTTLGLLILYFGYFKVSADRPVKW